MAFGKILLYTAACVIMIASSQPASWIWTGANTDFNVPENWLNGKSPSSSDSGFCGTSTFGVNSKLPTNSLVEVINYKYNFI